MSRNNSAEANHPPSKVIGLFITVFAVALTCGAIVWALDLFRKSGLLLYNEQFLSGILALAFPLVYLSVPAGKGRERKGRVPWYDATAAAVGFAAAAYTCIRFPVLAELITELPFDGLITGLMMIILLIEGLRRTVGKVLTIVVIGFILYGLFGSLVPGALAARPLDFKKFFYYLAWDPTSMLGIPLNIIVTIVIAFVLFGKILFKSGGSEFFTGLAMVLMGRYRGGAAKIAVLASALFGTISGSTVANVTTTGVITIPLMAKAGYPRHLAGAIEAVASTGGQLMPPVMGAAAFIMAEFLQTTYAKVVLAAVIPSILYYFSLFIEADLEAARTGIRGVEKERIPLAGAMIKSGWFFPLPFAALIIALFWFNYEPGTSALLATGLIAVKSIIFPYQGKRLRWMDLLDVLRSTGLSVLDILMIGGSAGLIIGVLGISGLGFGMTIVLVKMAVGNLFLLLLMSGMVSVILGMGMPTVGVYILLATLVAPALIDFGVGPMAAHMFLLYYGMMSMITPPVAIGAFAAASISGADPMRTGYSAMRFGWLALIIPFMFVLSPTLLMQGHALNIIWDFLMALLGVFLACIGVIGYFVRPINFIYRVLFIIAGISSIIPATGFRGAIYTDIFGLALGSILLGRELVFRHHDSDNKDEY
jgi:TRAP transporter 4TM/12TM fusion protein